MLHFLSLLFVTIGFAGQPPTPPMAEQKPHKLEVAGDARSDPYFWLHDKTDPNVLSYLKAENAYTDRVLAPEEKFHQAVSQEMLDHIEQNDSTFPEYESGYGYYTRTKKGLDYDIYCRKKLGAKNAKEEVILDVNLLAKGHPFISVSQPVASDDGKILAYGVDFKGDGVYTIHFKDLSNGTTLKDEIPDAAAKMAWAADNKTLFFAKQTHPDLRARWVYRRQLGSSHDDLVFDETDPKFKMWVSRTLTKKFILVESTSKDANEFRLVPTSEPSAAPKLFAPREPGFEYQIADGGDRFYIRTNWQAENFRLMETPIDSTERTNWKEVIPARPEIFLDSFFVFAKKIAALEREKGLPTIRVIDRESKAAVTVPIKESVYGVWIKGNREYNTDWLRFRYSSMSTPESTIEYSFKTSEEVVRKQNPVRGNFKSDNYVTKRIWATADDGTKVPISIVYKKTTKPTPTTPLLLYGYGAYGFEIDPYFSVSRLSLLDRGFVFAIAHIRGGDIMGRPWYLHGKLLEKKNTFTDFIACAQELFKEQISSPKHAYAMGESAGGLMLGAVLNMKPDLFNGVVASMPFLDVLTDMLDTSLPLTTDEFLEWGDPRDKKYYDYIKSYSPYDNVKAQNYPNLFVSAGLNDSSVFFWEPTKWVAKLRRMKTDHNLILYKIGMDNGHNGRSGMQEYFSDLALKYVFLFHLEGIEK